MKVKIYQCIYTGKWPLYTSTFLIQLFQGMFNRIPSRRYSHYAIQIDTERKGPVVLDSTFYGVDEKPEELWLKHYRVVTSYEFDLPQFGLAHFYAWFNKHHGKRYGFVQIVGIFFRILHLIKNNPFGKGAAAIICNELVILWLNRFVEYIADPQFVDSLDLLDTEIILDGMSERGLCKKESFPLEVE